jgi:YHS domain-containing protein/putative intracellular protease/amidase
MHWYFGRICCRNVIVASGIGTDTRSRPQGSTLLTISRRHWLAVSPLGLAAFPLVGAAVPVDTKPLKPPSTGGIPVAFAISDGAVVIDYSGPWEVFQDVNIPSRKEDGPVFNLYTVAETMAPITASGGLKIVPNFSFDTAPQPKIIVIPAQSGNPAMTRWIQKSFPHTDVTMSVCTGAFELARTGLLDGKSATTHHGAYAQFAKTYGSKIQLKRGARFVEEGQLATAGGLTSGIDLALRIVERYFGREVAANTAGYMEYQGEGWKDATGLSNAAYLESKGNSECPVCHMAVDASAVNHSTYKGQTYYFCSGNCKSTFDASPEMYANQV